MAIVVALADKRPQYVRRIHKEPVEAQILLFTGVRYERLDVPKRRPSQRASRVKTK